MRIKPISTDFDLMLKIGAAILMTFAVTSALVHAQLYFGSLIAQEYQFLLTSNDDQR